jgi:DNA-directed RNA polymerase subunit RPC12/RpoP
MHAKPNDQGGHTCQCPYCDHELEDACSPFCGGCGTTIYICTNCGKPFNKDKAVCPSCGTKVDQ